MKKRFIIILLCGLFIFGITTGCVKDKEDNNIENVTNTQDEKSIETIYEDDDGINLFINKYNEVNEIKITSDMLSKKHIGGSDRDDVVTVSNNKLEINIYDNYELSGIYNISVYVGYKTTITATVDDYKEQFVKYIKLFDDTLSDEDINDYWYDMISTYHSSYEINEIDIVTSTNNGTIQYFKFTKNLEL